MKIKPQHFARLAVVTALSVIIAGACYAYFNRWSAGKVEGAAVLPSLARDAGLVAAIELAQGDRKLTLEKAGELWRVRDRGGHPANPERVRSLIVALQNAQLIEPKTASRDKFKLLELEDPGEKDAKSRSVRLLDTKGLPVAEIVLGKSRHDAFGSGKGGTYVRRPTEDQTWLATGDLKAPLEIRDWVQAAIFEIEQAKIGKVTLEHPGEDPLVVEKGDGKEQKFKLAQVPDGMKLKQGAAVDQIPQGLASIDLEDVRKLDVTPTGDKVSVIKLEAEGGLAVSFRLRKDGDASWLSLSATGEGEAKKKADEINQRAGWEFKVPQWKADQISKRRADLLETS